MKKSTVVVIDDHKLVREMYLHLFASLPNLEVVGESGTFDESIEMVKSRRPDIVLLDINLAQASGFDAVPLIRKFSPGTRIIGLSMHSQPMYAKRMLQLGAKGYVTKNSSRQEMLRAIEEVIHGKVYICSEVKNILTEKVFAEEQGPPSVKDLSLREMDVIKMIKQGMSSKEIAAALFLSVKTVEVHRYNILRKLGLKNSAALVNYMHSSHHADHFVC